MEDSILSIKEIKGISLTSIVHKSVKFAESIEQIDNDLDFDDFSDKTEQESFGIYDDVPDQEESKISSMLNHQIDVE